MKLKKDNDYMTCWVDAYMCRKGSIIELKDVEGLWEVVETYSIGYQHDIKRKWNVGGL